MSLSVVSALSNERSGWVVNAILTAKSFAGVLNILLKPQSPR